MKGEYGTLALMLAALTRLLMQDGIPIGTFDRIFLALIALNCVRCLVLSITYKEPKP